MLRSFLIIIFLVFNSPIFCQLQNGSVAPDFDVEDVNGNTYSLYAMMGANKSACVGFEAVWCSFCWHFHESGVLQNVVNNLSAYTTAIMMESEWNTNTDCLYGLPTCNDYSWGDWVTGMPYFIADLSATNGPTVASDYNRYTYPLLYVISPDKRTWLIVDRTYANYESWITKSFTLNATGTLTNSNCGDNGKIILNVTGGFSNLKYKWSNGATTKDLNSIPGGTYTVTITDANQYFKSFGPFVIEGPEKRVDVTGLDLKEVKCFNQSTGSIEVQLSYGTLPYNYNWSNGIKTNLNTNLKAGNYTLTITDNHGCTRLKSYVINQPPLLTASATSVKEICDNTDGSIQAKGLGGYPPYVYDIGSGDQGSSEFHKLKGGRDYTITITDYNGCKESIKVNVDVSHKPKAKAGDDKPLDCIKEIINLDGSGSEQSAWITNQWSTTEGNIVSGGESLFPDINKPGKYYLKILNTNNKCFDIDSVFVIDARVFPNIDAVGDTILNCELTKSEIKGNSTDLQTNFYWKKLNDTIFYFPERNITVIDSGKYIFHVKDTLNLCISRDTVVIQADLEKPIALGIAQENVSCKNAEVVIDATASSQGANFSYQWTSTNGNIVSGANTLVPIVNRGGEYSLEVTNTSNHCTNVTTVSILEQKQPSAGFEQSINGLTAQFNDLSTGIPTSWNWTFGDGGISQLKNPEHAFTQDGEYEVCLTIENDCGQDIKCQKILVGISNALNLVSADILNVSCFNGSDGFINLTVQGGVPPYEYNWSNQQTTRDIVDLSAGDYSVQISDQQGTKINKTFSIKQPTEIVLSNSIITNATSGKSDGTVLLEVNGGIPQYSYLWSNGTLSNPAIDLMPGEYTCLVKDANDCIKEFGPFVVNQITSISNTKAVKQFILSPNPINGKGVIKLDFDKQRVFKLNVLNLFGESICSHISIGQHVSIPVDLNGYPSGLYFVVLTTENEQQALKWIVE